MSRTQPARPKKALKSTKSRTEERKVSSKLLRPRVVSEKTRATLKNWLTLAQLRSEKCELKEARVAFEMAIEQSKKAGDLRSTMEALSGLLRLAGEALDEAATERWEADLDALMDAYPQQIPAMAWYCKGAIAHQRRESKAALGYFLTYHRTLRAEHRELGETRSDAERDVAVAKGRVSMALSLWQAGKRKRAHWLAQELLRRYEEKNLKSINGILYLLLANIEERAQNLVGALKFHQMAHSSFLGEHNWYYHLYVLYGYARLSRIKQNYAEAYWYLDLMSKATQGGEFGLLQKEIERERERLANDAVDLLVDSRQCLVQTRENGHIELGKQYVLLDILEALTEAHRRPGVDAERGLSKAEIIQRVWREQYRPEAHDNKLYYNINRLRKLIEPDVRKPQYLLNWKEGYRLAPGLKVQFVGNENGGNENER